jgi:predicted transcriptional regulator
MASRGVSVRDIAARLEITDSAVRQLLKAAS